MRECPKCHKLSLSRNNPYGQMICTECGWLDASKESIAATHVLRSFFRWTVIAVLLVVFVGLFTQFFRWRQFSFKATSLQVEKMLFGNNQEIDLELGAICNSLNDYKCASLYFREVAYNHPRNKSAIANLAMAMSQLKQWQEAKPNFETYFALGGSAFDVAYWYGQTLMNLGDIKTGMEWLYYSLKLNPNFKLAVNNLVEKLLQDKEVDTALGLIGAVTRGKPNEFPKLKKSLDGPPFLNRKIIEKEELQLRIPSLDGISFYFPLIIKKNGRINFFRYDEKNEKNYISTEALNENLIKLSDTKNEKKVTINKQEYEVFPVELENVTLANVNLGNVKFYACKACPMTIGSELFRNFEIEKVLNPRVHFMNVKYKQ